MRSILALCVTLLVGCAAPPITRVAAPTQAAAEVVPSVVAVDTQGLAPCQLEGLAWAVSWWHHRAGVELFELRAAGSLTQAELGAATVVTIDPEPSVLPPTALGATVLGEGGGRLIILARSCALTAMVSAHELGHARGLQHHPERGHLMFWYMPDSGLQTSEAELRDIRANRPWPEE